MVDLSILNLNDDCLHHIFKYLSLKDLVNLAETLTRFRQILLDRPPTFYPVHHGNDPDETTNRWSLLRISPADLRPHILLLFSSERT
ncbi:uncharacterized protein LOC6546364 isoform X3 [Drosophila erecta]|uniref:uncharacterized protein LOC6546364 isoform X3 n=1 Tax=Drosophila erecta TaxID=7220 RepID=UPI000F046B05|nr:uncharacterized protein LOC6546364 isoform X3 [Drosophila erecta]